MSLLFYDSFDHYDTSQLTRKWTSTSNGVPAVSTTYGRNGTNGIHCDDRSAIKTLTSNEATLIVGAAVRVAALDGDHDPIFSLWDNGTLQCEITTSSDLSIKARGPGGVLGASGPSAIPNQSTQHSIELKATIHDTTGSMIVKVGGVVVLTVTGVDTKATANAYANQVSVGGRAFAGSDLYVDDFWVCNTAGSTNNDFLGDVRVECLFPDGAGGSTQLAPSAGTNSSCVDEAVADDDTTYVSSSTVGHKDRYTFGALAATTGSILAVAVNLVDRKDDAGSRTHSAVAHDGTSEGVGTAYAPTTSYANHQTIYETKPSTGAWTIALVNGMEAGHTLAA